MKTPTDAMLLRIYLTEAAKWEHKPLYEAIVMRAREQGLSGATVLRGPMGYGRSSHMHTAKILDLSMNLPVVIEIVETEAMVNAFLPILDQMLTSGQVTLEKVRVIHVWKRRGVAEAPCAAHVSRAVLLARRFRLALLGLGAFFFAVPCRAQAPQLPGPTSSPTSSPSSVPPFINQTYLLGDFGGERSKLEDEGFKLTPIYSAETFGNPTGGSHQGVIYEGLLDLELTIDLKKMADWDGTFHASSYYPMGSSLTDNDTNDLFRVSDIDAYDTLLLYELYYEQRFADGKVSIRFGQLGADTEFFISTGGANFLNSTYGWPAILGNNTPAPNYPYAALGARLQISPSDEWTFRAGVFSADPAPDRIGDPNPNRSPGTRYDNSGTDFNTSGGDGVFNIDELVYNLNQSDKAKGLPGVYKIGGWLDTGTFANLRYDDRGVPLGSPASDGRPGAVDGNFGFYFVADQAVWQNKSDADQSKTISLFTRGGSAEGNRSIFNYYIDGGVTFDGVIPGRPSDLFGVATAYGSIGPAAAGTVVDSNQLSGTSLAVPDYEANIEVTYFAQLAKWWTVQPDLQILIHPGGSAALPNALVLGVRTTVTF